MRCGGCNATSKITSKFIQAEATADIHNWKSFHVRPLFAALIPLIFPGDAESTSSYLDEGFFNSNVSSYPYFEFNVPRNVTTAVGQTAFLHCRVEQLGDKAVSSFVFILCLFFDGLGTKDEKVGISLWRGEIRETPGLSSIILFWGPGSSAAYRLWTFFRGNIRLWGRRSRKSWEIGFVYRRWNLGSDGFFWGFERVIWWWGPIGISENSREYWGRKSIKICIYYANERKYKMKNRR